VAPWDDSQRDPGFFPEQYGTEVSPDFISSVTDEVMEEIGAWQQRPLEPMYPVIFFDALRVKIRISPHNNRKQKLLSCGDTPQHSNTDYHRTPAAPSLQPATACQSTDS
jgi:putative transposase